MKEFKSGFGGYQENLKLQKLADAHIEQLKGINADYGFNHALETARYLDADPDINLESEIKAYEDAVRKVQEKVAELKQKIQEYSESGMTISESEASELNSINQEIESALSDVETAGSALLEEVKKFEPNITGGEETVTSIDGGDEVFAANQLPVEDFLSYLV